MENEELTTKEEQESKSFDEKKMAELIAQNVNTSIKEALKDLPQQQAPQPVQQQQQQKVEPDIWDDIVGSRVNPHLANANLQSAIASDKIDFYSSDDWLEEVDNLLLETDPVKRKAEREEIRKDIETKFSNLVSSNRGIPRKDIFSAVIGERVKKDRAKYEEASYTKRNKSKEAELDKARKAVDISSGNISNFNAADVYEMDHAKMLKEYGNVPF